MFFSPINITNAVISSNDVTVGNQNKIKLSPKAASILGLPQNNVLVVFDPTSKSHWIAGVDAESKLGRGVNKQFAFMNESVAVALGGNKSEYEISEETAEAEGVTYFKLTEKVNGAAKRAVLASQGVIEEEEVEEAEEVTTKA